jgi:uncharacterized protein (DUF4415 family)
MSAKRRKSVRILSRTDDAPEITSRWAAEADLYNANKLVRRGRPKLEDPKRLLSIRIRASAPETPFG